MAYENSMLSQDLEFYSAYDYEEKEGNGTENFFTQLLWKVLLGLTLLITIFFIYNYFTKINIDFKKFDFWNSEKYNEMPMHKINRDSSPTESRIIIREVDSKTIGQKDIVEKIMEDIYKEKQLDRPNITSPNTFKPTKKVSQEQEKKPYLVDEYLEAIKKELGKN